MSGKKTIFTCRLATVKDNWRQNNDRSGLVNASGSLLPKTSYMLVLGVLVLYTLSSPKNFSKLVWILVVDVFYRMGREF